MTWDLDGGKEIIKSISASVIDINHAKLRLIPSVAALLRVLGTPHKCHIAHFFLGATTRFVKSARFIQMGKVTALVEFGELIFKSHKNAIFVRNLFL